MKRILFLLPLAGLLLHACGKDDAASAETQEEQLPELPSIPPRGDICEEMEDELFKAFCREHFDTNGNKRIEPAEAETVTEIAGLPADLFSLKGIERFANLQRLVCDGTLLASFDLRYNRQLETLSCKKCIELRSFSLHVPALETFVCDGAGFESLTLQGYPQLKTFSCKECDALRTLTLQDCPQLQAFSCKGCDALRTLTLCDTSLERLDCDGTRIAALELTDNRLLRMLSCRECTELKSLALHGTSLESIQCGGLESAIESLDLRDNPHLKSLSGTAFNQTLRTVDLRETALEAVDFQFCYELTEVSLPSTVRKISAHAFEGCQKLAEIALSPQLFEIDAWAFAGCSALKRIDLPESLATICERAFSCCGLTEVRLPGDLRSIREAAFYGCVFSRIEIPESVTRIDADAFSGNNELSYVKLPSGLTEIELGTFSHCPGLTRIDFPAALTRIAQTAFAYSFNQWESPADIILPEGLTAIEENAFHSTSLASVDLPSTLTEIGKYSFAQCSPLKRIVCRATTPPSLLPVAYEPLPHILPVQPATQLYVPAGSVGAYAGSEWGALFSEILPIE